MDPRRPVFSPRPHLVLPVRRDPAGVRGPTLDETRGRGWRRSSWGLYVDASVPLTTEQRILEAACRLPSYGGVTGWAAFYWQGATRWFEGTLADGSARPVPLAVAGDDIRRQSGIQVSEERLDPRDLMRIDGLRLTSPVRSACFEMRYARDAREAGVIASMAAYHDVVSLDELAEYADRHSGWTGIPRCRAGIVLADENCWSPPEARMVQVWQVEAELPRPLCNAPVFDLTGIHVGTPDLLDVEAGVVGQYEGGLHLAGEQRDIDVRAEERYRQLGLECFTMRSNDLRSPTDMATRMRAARARARWEPESQRAWTTRPPAWWKPTHTVERRRALSDQDRDRWLRYRQP